MSIKVNSSVLRVDVDALDDAARLLDTRPGPLDPATTEPRPGAVGHRGTAAELAAFSRSYRTTVAVLDADNDASAAHLRAAATTYRGTDTYRR